MPTKRIQLVNGEIYHIVTRAVGDTTIFNNESDFYRGIFSIYEFNNDEPVEIWLRRKQRKREKKLGDLIPQRDLLVDVLLFCFMPNHVHLLLRQSKDNGISSFMHKFGAGYASYYNIKYDRKGHLLNRFKAVQIKDDKQLQTVFNYIHCNPISLVQPGWKESGIVNYSVAKNFLGGYRWSSYLDYIGEKNFPSITDRNFLLELLDGEKGCGDSIKDWIKYKGKPKRFGTVALE